jgi:hypothetical protein
MVAHAASAVVADQVVELTRTLAALLEQLLEMLKPDAAQEG